MALATRPKYSGILELSTARETWLHNLSQQNSPYCSTSLALAPDGERIRSIDRLGRRGEAPTDAQTSQAGAAFRSASSPTFFSPKLWPLFFSFGGWGSPLTEMPSTKSCGITSHHITSHGRGGHETFKILQASLDCWSFYNKMHVRNRSDRDYHRTVMMRDWLGNPPSCRGWRRRLWLWPKCWRTLPWRRERWRPQARSSTPYCRWRSGWLPRPWSSKPGSSKRRSAGNPAWEYQIIHTVLGGRRRMEGFQLGLGDVPSISAEGIWWRDWRYQS